MLVLLCISVRLTLNPYIVLICVLELFNGLCSGQCCSLTAPGSWFDSQLGLQLLLQCIECFPCILMGFLQVYRFLPSVQNHAGRWISYARYTRAQTGDLYKIGVHGAGQWTGTPPGLWVQCCKDRLPAQVKAELLGEKLQQQKKNPNTTLLYALSSSVLYEIFCEQNQTALMIFIIRM